MYNDKVPPYDLNAEEAVIGSLLIDGPAIYKIASTLWKTDFYHELNALIYDACISLYQRNEAINQVTVAQELERQSKLELCGGVAHLSHLISVVPTSLDIEHYAQIVCRLSVNRQLIGAGRDISNIGLEANPDVAASVGRAEEILFKLRSGQGAHDFIHVRQILEDYFQPKSGQAEGGKARGKVMTEFVGLDELMGGLQPSDLVIVGGRPSMGKTSLVMNVARNAAISQGATVAIFSLEMSAETLVMRLISGESGVNYSQIRLGEHGESEERRIMHAIGVLSEAPIYVDDTPQLRVFEMRSKARRLFFERGVDMIIIDHLGLMQGEGRIENRVQEISFISRSLKGLARELNVPVIAVSQLSRASEIRVTHRPQLSDLRDSGSIEQDADLVMFIYREEYYTRKEDWDTQNPDREYPEGIAEVIIAKHRNGPTGQVKLHFLPKLAKFENIANQEPSLI